MTVDLSIYSKHTVGKRIAANTGLMVGSKSLAAILGLGSLSIAAKVIAPVELGTIIFLHVYMLFFSEVATFQTWQSIIRFGTDDLKENNSKSLAGLLNFALKLDAIAAVFSFFLAISVFSIFTKIAGNFPGRFADWATLDIPTLRNYLVVYCGLLLFRQRGVSIGIFRLFDKFNILAFQGLIMPTTRFVGVLIAAATNAGFTGFLLAWFCIFLQS